MNQPEEVGRKVQRPIAIRRSAASLATVHSGELKEQSVNSHDIEVAMQPCNIRLIILMAPQVKQASIRYRSDLRPTVSKASLARRSKVRTTPVGLLILAVSRWQQH